MLRDLINSVEGGVSGVQLDGGEDSLSGGGGRDSVVGEGGGSKGSSDGEGGGKTSGIGVRETETGDGSSNNLGRTTLPGGSGSLGSFNSSKVLGLGGGNLRGVLYGGGANKVENGTDGEGDVKGGRGGGEVGTGHTETVDRVSNIVDGLQDTVGVHILIRSLCNSESVARLSSGRWTTSMTESKLSKLILSMELMRLLERSDGPGGSGDKLSATGAHASCQYNQSVHV
jgi:hypothetical protein